MPLIDFSKFLQASSDAEKRRTAREVVDGFKDVGFIYLEKHSIPEDTVKNVFDKVNSLRIFVDLLANSSACFARAQSSSSCLRTPRCVPLRRHPVSLLMESFI